MKEMGLVLLEIFNFLSEGRRLRMNRYIECNGQRFEVHFKHEKELVWAIAYVNGEELRKHGDSEETAYWTMEQRIYQALNFRLGKNDEK